MSVVFSGQAEKERIANRNKLRHTKTWELLETASLVEAVHFARDHGWKENKVQIRESATMTGSIYYVEPYEACNCPSLLKYEDYLARESA